MLMLQIKMLAKLTFLQTSKLGSACVCGKVLFLSFRWYQSLAVVLSATAKNLLANIFQASESMPRPTLSPSVCLDHCASVCSTGLSSLLI